MGLRVALQSHLIIVMLKCVCELALYLQYTLLWYSVLMCVNFLLLFIEQKETQNIIQNMPVEERVINRQ